MASRIQGITVEIGGDTTKLQRALKGVNTEIRNTQSQLRDVDKLLKLDPGNTELLAQKERLLAQAVQETKEKLETLKTAAEQADQALKDGTITQEQYDGLQREIAETEAKLKSLEEQANQSATALQKIAATGEKLQNVGDTISGVGKKMMPVTVGVVALGTAAVTTAANFEFAMSQVQATMGITKDSMSEVDGQSVNTMDTLSDLAKEMGETTAFSATECVEALNYLALDGYNTQEMCDTLPTVLNLAAAGGIELADASDMVTDAMSALGMGTSEADTMVDQMARTASTTNTSVAQLGEGILKIGATAKNMAGGTAELNMALGILANNGIKGAEGDTHLRNVILSLQQGCEDGAIAAFNAVCAANPYVIIIAAIIALVAAFIYLWNNYEEFRQFWIDLWEGIKEAAIAVWEALKTFFTEAWEAIKSTAETVWTAVSEFFTGLWDGIRNTFTTVVNAISTFLSTAWNTIKTTATTIWTAISTFFTNIWNGIKNAVTIAMNAIKTAVTAGWNAIKSTVTSVGNAIKTAVTTLWNNVTSAVKNAMTNVFNAVKSGFSKVKEYITGLASQAYNWGKDLIMGIVNGIKSVISKVGEAAKSVADKIKEFLHFSTPDTGPLADYETWMPDFMKGLTKGIEKSKGVVADAMAGLAGDMTISPNVLAAQGAYASGGYPGVSSSDIVSGISGALNTALAGAGGSGDIVIPVYIGSDMIDEIVVTAQQRMNLKSGGR